MLVGLNSRPEDMAVNITREKKQTNIRSSTSEIAVKLSPPLRLSLEQALDFIEPDELVEVTPLGFRHAQTASCRPTTALARGSGQCHREASRWGRGGRGGGKGGGGGGEGGG